MLVPVVGLYFLFVHREELLAADGQPFVWGRFLRPGRLYAGLIMVLVGSGITALSYHRPGTLYSLTEAAGRAVAILGALAVMLDWAIGTTVFGLAVFVYGIYPGQNDYVKDIGMVATLFGVVLLAGGRQIMRIAWFPIVFLVCAIPWPGLVYSWVTEPLSQLAAQVAVQVLRLTGVNAGVVGTKIVMKAAGRPEHTLNVAEACAGLRSLMTYISVGAAIAFLSARPLWQKLTIIVSTIPIAITCNLLRISIVGELDRVNRNWSEGFAHQFVGLLMLIPAFLMILTVLWILEKIFIEEADDDSAAGAAAVAVKKTAPMILKKATATAAPVAVAAPMAVTTPIAAPMVAKIAPVPDRPTVVAATVPAGVQPKSMTTTAASPMPKTVAAPVTPRVVAPSAVSPAVARPAAIPVNRPVQPVSKPGEPTANPPAANPPSRPAVAPPRPAGIVPPRPAGIRPPGSPPVRPRGTPAGIVPPRPAGPAGPPAVKPAASAAGAAVPAAGTAAPAAVTPPRPAGPRAIVPPRPPQQVVPPKPKQETP